MKEWVELLISGGMDPSSSSSSSGGSSSSSSGGSSSSSSGGSSSSSSGGSSSSSSSGGSSSSSSSGGSSSSSSNKMNEDDNNNINIDNNNNNKNNNNDDDNNDNNNNNENESETITVPIKRKRIPSTQTRRSARINPSTIEPTTIHSSLSSLSTVTASYELTISFIQVCRNYLRYPLWRMSEHSLLEYLYKSASAFYTYENCPTFDIVASMRKEDKYYPLFVSVKNWENCPYGKAKSLCDNMKTVCENGKVSNAICLLILVGLEDAEETRKSYEEKIDDYLLKTIDIVNFNNNVNNNNNEIVSKIVIIPNNDIFGVDKMVRECTSVETEISEIYSSHAHLAVGGDGDSKQKHYISS